MRSSYSRKRSAKIRGFPTTRSSTAGKQPLRGSTKSTYAVGKSLSRMPTAYGSEIKPLRKEPWVTVTTV
jgi:hypothetical protein